MSLQNLSVPPPAFAWMDGVAEADATARASVSTAVVTKDVEPYAIVAGVPAKFLRWRFEPSISRRIIALSWWDWSHDRLADAIDDMQTMEVEDFLAKYEG